MDFEMPPSSDDDESLFDDGLDLGFDGEGADDQITGEGASPSTGSGGAEMDGGSGGENAKPKYQVSSVLSSLLAEAQQKKEQRDEALGSDRSDDEDGGGSKKHAKRKKGKRKGNGGGGGPSTPRGNHHKRARNGVLSSGRARRRQKKNFEKAKRSIARGLFRVSSFFHDSDDGGNAAAADAVASGKDMLRLPESPAQRSSYSYSSSSASSFPPSSSSQPKRLAWHLPSELSEQWPPAETLPSPGNTSALGSSQASVMSSAPSLSQPSLATPDPGAQYPVLFLGARDFIHRARHQIIGTPSEAKFFEWLLDLAAFGRGAQASSAILATEHIRELIALAPSSNGNNGSSPASSQQSSSSSLSLSASWLFSSAHLWRILIKMGCRLFDPASGSAPGECQKLILPIFQIPENRTRGGGSERGIFRSSSSSASSSSSSSFSSSSSSSSSSAASVSTLLQSSPEDNLRLVLEVLLLCLTHNRVSGLGSERVNPDDIEKKDGASFGWLEAAATLGALSVDASLRGAQIQLEHGFREILKRLVNTESEPHAVQHIVGMLLSYTTRSELMCVSPSIGRNLGDGMPPIMRFRCASKIVLLMLSNMYFLTIEPALELRFQVAARLLLRSLEVGKIEAAETVARAAAIMASNTGMLPASPGVATSAENTGRDAQTSGANSLRLAPARGIETLEVVHASKYSTLEMCKKIVGLKASMEEDEEDWDMLHDLLLMLRMCESYCGRKREECGVGMGVAYYADLERSLQDLEVRRQGFVPEIAKYAELVGSFKGQIATSAARGNAKR